MDRYQPSPIWAQTALQAFNTISPALSSSTPCTMELPQKQKWWVETRLLVPACLTTPLTNSPNLVTGSYSLRFRGSALPFHFLGIFRQFCLLSSYSEYLSLSQKPPFIPKQQTCMVSPNPSLYHPLPALWNLNSFSSTPNIQSITQENSHMNT